MDNAPSGAAKKNIQYELIIVMIAKRSNALICINGVRVETTACGKHHVAKFQFFRHFRFEFGGIEGVR
jgi:hypothetical protein